MELSEFYPAPDDLIKSEVDVLNFLRDEPFIKEKHSQFAQDAAIYYGRYRSSRSGFEFNSFFDVWHGPMHRKNANRGQGRRAPNARLWVSALLEVNKGAFSNVTYCFAVSRIRRLTILRKFHFDVTVSSHSSQRRLQGHPRCHLQYCGKMIPHMETMGCRAPQLEQMHPWLSEPRIFFWPMSLALLIDMALHEFPDLASAKFRASNEWRGIVRARESLLLRPFYEKCVEVIRNTHGKNQTLADEFYVG